MANEEHNSDLIELTADLVAAYVSNNPIPVGELTALIASVHSSLTKVADGSGSTAPVAPTPAVAVKKSVTPDFIISLEDGKKYKSLKRHLQTSHGLTPDAYREKWGLPKDYPMVAPNYAAARSALAKQLGLGRKPAAPKPAPKSRKAAAKK